MVAGSRCSQATSTPVASTTTCAVLVSALRGLLVGVLMVMAPPQPLKSPIVP
jgi:hypothetical protein